MTGETRHSDRAGESRVFPVGAVGILHGLCAVLFCLYAAMAALEDGLVQVAASGVAGSALLLWVAAARVTLLRNTTDDDPVGVDVDLRASGVVVASLLGAWGLMLLSVVLWVIVLLTDAASLDSPGFMIITVLGAIGSLPDLLRLARGRLHRWTIRTDETGFHYAGWHTRLDVPWSDVRGFTGQDRPAGVLVRLGDGESITLTVTPFDVTPAGLATRLQSARSLARR